MQLCIVRGSGARTSQQVHIILFYCKKQQAITIELWFSGQPSRQKCARPDILQPNHHHPNKKKRIKTCQLSFVFFNCIFHIRMLLNYDDINANANAFVETSSQTQCSDLFDYLFRLCFIFSYHYFYNVINTEKKDRIYHGCMTKNADRTNRFIGAGMPRSKSQTFLEIHCRYT